MSCADYAAVSRQQNLERVCESPAWLVLGCINEKRRVLRVYVPPHLLTSTDPNQSNPAPKHTHTPAPRRSWCGSRSGPSGARSTMSYVPGRAASAPVSQWMFKFRSRTRASRSDRERTGRMGQSMWPRDWPSPLNSNWEAIKRGSIRSPTPAIIRP